MNVPFTNLTPEAQELLSKEFSNHIGRQDWKTVLHTLQDQEVIICAKLNEDNPKYAQSLIAQYEKSTNS